MTCISRILLSGVFAFALAAPAAAQTAPPPSGAAAAAAAAAADENTVVIPASFLLGDVADFDSSLNFGPPSPGAYRLDPSRSYFAVTKAFPENDVLRVSQTWQSWAPNRIDNAPDPRSLEIL